MKVPAVVFLFALLSAALGAEERLIPLDEFSITVPLTKGANPKGLKVDVWMHRPMREPMDETVPYEQRHGVYLLGDAGTDVQCPTIRFSEKMLLPDDQAAVLEACAAAVKGQEYHKETERKFRQAEWNYKTVYEVVTVEGAKRVRIGRSGVDGGGDAFLDPAEGARLTEVLVKAAAAFDILNLDGSHALVKGSFAVAQLAQFRAVEAQKAARATWFAEHEGWLFERE